MELDPEERILLTKEEIERIDEACKEAPKLTDYMRQYINGLRKRNETKT
jgi:hypothetical protein